MGIVERVRGLLDPVARADGERCGADWRRPDGYWRCTRSVGHAGRHRMRAAERLLAAPVLRRVEPREERDGGVAAG